MEHVLSYVLSSAFPSNLLLPLAGIIACLLSYILTTGIIIICRRFGWVEPVQEGKIHTRAIPRLGGVAIFLSFLFTSLVFYAPFLDTAQAPTETIFGHTYAKELVIYGLLIVACVLIVSVHAYDDLKGLKPLPKLLAQTAAVLILLGPGLHVFHGVLFFGIHNPFVHGGTQYNPALPWYRQPTLTLLIRDPTISWQAIPAVLFTWFWIVGMMNAINFIDGLDGLATGMAAIVGLFITVTSWILHQYSLATLAAIFTGATLGFLPLNWKPAKIIMGDSGSQFLGMALAVLAVMSGAKFALILMLLGLPILDIAWVMVNRIRRGQHPMQRDLLPLYASSTHLHYRLLFGGLDARQICYILYAVTGALGLLALTLSSFYKILGVILVGIIMSGLLYWSNQLQNKKKREQQALLTKKEGA